MNYLISFLILTAVTMTSACSNQPDKTKLSASEFETTISEHPGAAVIDVRTPEEYEQGHLTGAENYDWNGAAFYEQIAPLDKSQPVFVYCLSGKRSGEAAAAMRTDGFSTVYELEGGITAWRTAGLPEVKGR